jgi:hypothetical protein
MKPAQLIVALMFVLTSAVAAFAADSGAAGAIAAAVKAHVTKEVVESVYVEKIVGDFAVAIVSAKDSDGGMAYVKKTASGWTVLHYGNALTEAALAGLGVPAESAQKLAE